MGGRWILTLPLTAPGWRPGLSGTLSSRSLRCLSGEKGAQRKGVGAVTHPPPKSLAGTWCSQGRDLEGHLAPVQLCAMLHGTGQSPKPCSKARVALRPLGPLVGRAL